MIEQFSPTMRKFIAIAICLLFCLLCFQLVISPVIASMNSSREALADSRFELARLQDIVSRPSPPAITPVDAAFLLKARDTATAQQAMLSYISSSAQVAGVTANVTFAEQPDIMRGQVSGQITAQGSEQNIIRFLTRLENGRPLTRMSNWSIDFQPDQPGQIILSGRILASWEQD